MRPRSRRSPLPDNRRPATMRGEHDDRRQTTDDTMATKLTVEQVATLERVWLETANASEAARQAGCHEKSARNYIIRRGLPKSAELYAEALAREERLHLATVKEARHKVRDALKVAGTDSGSVAELTRAANDSLRAVTATRVAHMKVSGLSAPDRTDLTTGGEKFATVVVMPPLENVRTATDASPLAAESGPTD